MNSYSESTGDFHTHFSDVLVIINYNHAHYESLPFLQKIYSEFPNVVFYGDAGGSCSAPPTVYLSDQKAGYLSYKSFIDACERLPNYRGYLFIMDDVLLRPQKLAELPLDSVWSCTPKFTSSSTCNVKKPPTQEEKNWIWWGDEQYGRVACERAWKNFTGETQSKLTQKYGSDYTFVHGFSDLFYIPGEFLQPICDVLKVCYTEKVFLEIAVPTAISAHCKGSASREVHIKPLWGKRQRILWPLYALKNEYDGVHPVKFSMPGNKKLALLLARYHSR